MQQYRSIRILCVASAMGAIATGCASKPTQRSETIGSLWRQSATPDSRRATTATHRNTVTIANSPIPVQPNSPDVATVNGRGISRATLIDLVLRSRGVGVLEQLIALETARASAAARGLTVTGEDVERERSRMYRRVADPLMAVTTGSLDAELARRLLSSILQERNISREEFEIILHRNAYLRKIVESEQSFTDRELRDEYDRAFGRRVRVRHIQLATAREVARIQERLAGGESFEDLARRYSANEISAVSGGLLIPFSRSDDRVPEALRTAAFSLSLSEVSGAVRAGAWYHLLRLEEIVPAEAKDFESVRNELAVRLGERRSEAQMFERYEKLFRDATIVVHDPMLREAYQRAHPGTGG